MAYDLGDVATLAIQIKDSTGALANAGTVVATVTAPDGTNSTPSVTNSTTGNYSTTFTATQVGRHSIRWVATGTNAGAYTDIFDILDPALLPIVSLSDFKAHLNITSTTDDEELRFTLAQATDLAEQYLHRALRRKTLIETYDGGGTSVVLRNPPVMAITSVTEAGNLLGGTDYTIDTTAGILYRGSAIARLPFFPGRQNIVVTYVAGYANPPLSVVRGVMDIGRWLWQQSQQGPRPGFGQSATEQGYLSDALPSWLYRPLDALNKIPGIA